MCPARPLAALRADRRRPAAIRRKDKKAQTTRRAREDATHSGGALAMQPLLTQCEAQAGL
jgi:hypothetical protein